MTVLPSGLTLCPRSEQRLARAKLQHRRKTRVASPARGVGSETRSTTGAPTVASLSGPSSAPPHVMGRQMPNGGYHG
eukprot:scaffold80914_cov30-Tisochrysis_lutea.AAC.3